MTGQRTGAEAPRERKTKRGLKSRAEVGAVFRFWKF